MATINWKKIDRIVYINLKRRKDRRVLITRQLKKLGVPREKIVRFDAVEHNPGYIGCVKSHILVLDMAKENKWDNVLILEDDIEFLSDDHTIARLNKYFTALENIKWDVAFLAANYHNVTRLKSVDYLVKVNKAWCACAYIVNSNYYDTLINNYIECFSALLKGGAQQHFALDVHWHSLMASDCWLGIFPNAGFQRADKSDIEQKRVDYRSLFAKPLSQITQRPSAAGSSQLPIRVDFYFQWAPGWTNFESVLDAMRASKQYDCRIVVMPYLSYGATSADCKAQCELLESNDIPYIDYHNYSLDERNPHVVFLQNPYDETRPGEFSSESLHLNNVNVAYIPYGLDMGDGERNLIYQYNLPCHNLARWVFVRSEHHKKEYGCYCSAGNKHVYVTGHPKLDYYAARYGMKKKNANKIKTVLWAPHFVMPSEEKMWSTFNIYTSVMLDVMGRGDVNLIIRPHPLFKQFMNASMNDKVKSETENNLQRLLDLSEGKDNVVWDFSSDYKNAFAQSDALMADAGSFLLEYLPSHKPILYLTHKDCLGINSSADFIYQAYDVAWDEKSIVQFIDNLVSDRDPHRETRLQSLKDELYLPAGSAGQEIAKVILQDLCGEESL